MYVAERQGIANLVNSNTRLLSRSKRYTSADVAQPSDSTCHEWSVISYRLLLVLNPTRRHCRQTRCVYLQPGKEGIVGSRDCVGHTRCTFGRRNQPCIPGEEWWVHIIRIIEDTH